MWKPTLICINEPVLCLQNVIESDFVYSHKEDTLLSLVLFRATKYDELVSDFY